MATEASTLPPATKTAPPAATEPLPTGIGLTALDPAFRENPYPILAALREREPIHRDEQLGRWLFTRHRDVNAILRNPNYWSDSRKANPGTFSREFLLDEERDPSMLLMDDPEHRRLRDLVRRPFAPGAVESWRPRVRAIARRTIDAIEDGEFDLIDRVANPIPTVVIAELLGLDASKHDQFKAWSNAMIKVGFTPVVDPEDARVAEIARNGLREFFLAEIERRRREPGDDLISHMVTAQRGGDRLTDAEIVGQCNLLLLAGNLTTTDLIGNGVMALLHHPEEQAKLRARPALMKNAVEEVLRYDSPVTNSGRILHEDQVFDGIEIAKGESLSVSLAAANRDPEVYPDPDRFDIERDNSHLQSFGGGAHFCLGAHLARMEAAEAFAALLDRFSQLKFGSGGHQYSANPSFRGCEYIFIEGER